MDDDEYEYRITPKGCMALFLMQEFNFSDWNEVEALVQKLDDLIFKAGYIYMHESEVQLLEE